ncbi:Pheromone-processing carboxypeptidase KEX1 [Zalerion maritima]|uniref:Carboxypeptidase n=1 Tax=Zalerion maritima TaxID=339359 RepID=A0AAD5WRV9_9PEZI|nr:Pheromone-processing carboxypeptidase KEX1 [Zalerion maritima]
MGSRWWSGPRRLCVGLAVTLSLSLSPSLVSADSLSSAADYFVHSLPGAPKDRPLVKMHAGHIEVTPEHNGHLFFWHFANNHIADKQRTVIWINGGPGCSSEDGALMEIGPYRVKSKDELAYNNGTWNEFANLLFVDNPVGTGYSYVDTDSYVHELDEMASQFVDFLDKWFKFFPEYEHDDIYIAGESYAGQHIPYIAKHILERNKNADKTKLWNIQGLIIGNGWISPREQYDSYLKFAYEKGLVEKGSDLSNELQGIYRSCERQISVQPDKVDLGDCEAVLQGILSKTRKKGPDGKDICYNMYDVRLTDSYSSCGMNWPPDLEFVTPYLRRDDVTAALNLNVQKNTGWTECSGAVGQAFRAKNSKPSIQILPELLEQVPITLFSGAEDLICNHIGTEEFISNMEWNGGKGFEISPGNWAPRREWTFEGMDAGFWQSARNLTYVLFNEASHMVPFDWPRRSRDMLDRVMGVDVAQLGLLPTESKLDGEEGFTSGKNDTSSPAQEEAEDEIEKAKWEAYRKSGGVVLVIVIIAASAWGFFVWRERKKRQGYQGIPLTGPTASGPGSGGALGGFRNKRTNDREDLEAGDFDESQLDDLHAETPTGRDGRYDIGGVSDDEDKDESKPMTGNGRSGRPLTTGR